MNFNPQETPVPRTAPRAGNSENVLVVWHSPELTRAYLEHFERNYARAVAFELRY